MATQPKQNTNKQRTREGHASDAEPLDRVGLRACHVHERLELAVLEAQRVGVSRRAHVAGIPRHGRFPGHEVEHAVGCIVVELAREVQLLCEVLNVPLGALAMVVVVVGVVVGWGVVVVVVVVVVVAVL